MMNPQLHVAMLAIFAVLLLINGANGAVLRMPVQHIDAHPSMLASLLHSRRSAVYEPQRTSLTTDDLQDHADIPIHNYFGSMYVGQIQLGTPPQAFTITFDTSCGLWVPSRKFKRNHVYDHTKSSTYKANGTWIDMNIISGIVSQDVLHVGAIQVPDVSFIEINQTKIRDLFYLGKFDGEFGVGLSAIPLESPVVRMMQAGVLDEPVVAFYLRDAKDGIVTIGGVDKTLFLGELSYVDVASPQQWGFPVDAVKAGNVELTAAREAILMMIPYIFGPLKQIAALARVVGAQQSTVPGVYTIDCSTASPDIEFVLHGKTYALPKDDYIIHSGSVCLWAFITSSDIRSGDIWVIGTMFTRKFYTVLDFGTESRKPRVGFAPAVKTKTT